MNGSRPILPRARGPLSDAVIEALRGEERHFAAPSLGDVDLLSDHDAQLALTCCYELHYESFAAVEDAWEWSPELLDFRARLEQAFVDRLTEEIGPPPVVAPTDVVAALVELAESDGPSLSTYVASRARFEELREFCVHRSEYQRKEADPHTWVIPRLRGRAKAAAVAIQHDEYGAGVAGEMHAELFATTMQELGLDPTYGAYRDLLPGSTLATGNLVTMLGLHRRWRAACVGHLALFEMTSVVPMSRYAATMRRVGVGAAGRRFYDVHVTADARHEQIALVDLVSGLLDLEPDVGGDVLFGARALMAVEGRFAANLMEAWERDASSLLAPIPESLAA